MGTRYRPMGDNNSHNNNKRRGGENSVNVDDTGPPTWREYCRGYQYHHTTKYLEVVVALKEEAVLVKLLRLEGVDLLLHLLGCGVYSIR